MATTEEYPRRAGSLHLGLTKEERADIDWAALHEDVTTTVFIRRAALREARRVNKKRRTV